MSGKRWLIGGVIAFALIPMAPTALDAALSRMSQRHAVARVIVEHRYQPGQYVATGQRARDPWGQPLRHHPEVPRITREQEYWYSSGPDGRAGTRDDVIPRTRHLIAADWARNRSPLVLVALVTLVLWWRFEPLLRAPRANALPVELARALRLAAPPCALTGLAGGVLLGFGPAWNLVLGPALLRWRAEVPAALPLELSFALSWFALGYALALGWRLRRPAA